MKFNKLIGLSIFLGASIGVVACANKSNPGEILKNNEDVYQDNSPNPSASDGYCLLTFDGNGGTFNGGSSSTFFQVRKGHNWARIKDKLTVPMTDDTGWDSKPSGKEFKFWLTRENKVIFDEYVFNEENVTLTAKWGEHYEPKKFATDSWDQVIQAANQGLEKLEEEYKFESTEYTNDTFIIEDPNNTDEVNDKTRYVNIEGLVNPFYGEAGHEEIKNPCDWPVHVIGISHDLIKDSPKTTAALTFEFSYAPIPAYGWDRSGDAGHQSWENSDLRDYLNSYFYLQFEDELQSGIQTIRKNVDDGTNSDNIITLDEKIFIPSVSEVADPDTLNRIGVPASFYENSRYQYYNQTSTIPQSSYLIKTNPFVGGEKTKTWLRSPYLRIDDIGHSKSQAMLIKDDATASSLITDEMVNIPHSVCPCFAIGENPECAVIVDVGEGLAFEAKEGFAKVGTNYEARIKVNDTFGGYKVPNSLDNKIQITINGTTTTLVAGDDYTYDNAQGTLTIKGSAIQDGATQIVIDLAPDMDPFQAAPWSEVVEEADKGIASFKEHFGYDEEASLAGLQKYLTIDGVKYRTHIVDETYDPLSDGTGTATLTFEFLDAIGGAGVYDDVTNTNFPESQLNFRLSSFAQDKMPFKLAEVRKPITTKTNDVWSLTYYDAKLFPISTAELNQAGSEVDEREYYDVAYDYYQNYSGNYDFYRYLPGTQTTVPVWLRTPNANNCDVFADVNNNIKIDENGRTSYDCRCTDNNYVAPCFCVGHDHVTANVMFSGALDNFTINDSEPKTLNVPVGEPLTIENIAIKPIMGSIPDISEDNILITNDVNLFEDWNLISYGGNKYDIVINRVPIGGLEINVTFPTQCLTVSLDPNEPTPCDISFVKGQFAPDTSLVYSTNGITFQDYTYGTSLTLDEISDRIYFKAKEGANNTHFADVTEFDEVPSTDYITQLTKTPTDISTIRVEGNIMSLLGDGYTYPTTIDANSAFTGMFMNLYRFSDARGLVFPATGTSNDTFEAKGTYAYMFYNVVWLYYAPAKITGFNDYGEGKVTDTYRSMFSGEDYGQYGYYAPHIYVMPYCDFSRTCPHMCDSMFKYCQYMYDLNNVVTDQFNYDYSDYCFAYMFDHARFYYWNHEYDVPDAIGSSEVDAAPHCCEGMFSYTRIPKTPNMMCNRPDVSSFAYCFNNSEKITEATITVKEISAGSKPYDHFLYGRGSVGFYVQLQDLYIYGLENLTDWPGTDFDNWLGERGGSTGGNPTIAHANANVIAAIENYGRTTSSIPELWTLLPL